ncbi:MAG: ATP-binding protein [Cardiobacteriaceae bacterium]|nr:ATP-binding protein [Cardiobacteriaceae bacterium]
MTMHGDIQIPLHDPGRIIKITGEESVLYRCSMLRVFNTVRIVVSLLFLLGYVLSGLDKNSLLLLFPFGMEPAEWFLLLTVLYLSALGTHWILSLRAPVSEQLFLSNALFDIVLLSLLVINVGMSGNTSLLMLIVLSSVLLTSLTLTVRQALVYAIVLALCWIVVSGCLRMLSLSIWPQLEALSWGTRISKFTALFFEHADLLLEPLLLGIGMSFLALLVSYLSTQGRDNRINAELNRSYTRQLRKMNDSIIEDMQNGLLVISNDGAILTLNRQARTIFGMLEQEKVPRFLGELMPELAQRFGRWQHMRFNDSRTLPIGKGSYSLNFSALKSDDMSLTLLMLESIDESYQRVRETRLASLGRLTAGIAHEIRNPLSSVQSAADLLEEMSEDPKIHFLTDKIRNNTQRMNNIISDILNLFSDKPRNTKLIRLNLFLQRIIAEARMNNETSKASIRADIDATNEYAVFFDAGHLEQILHNLMLNAVKHARRDDVEIIVRTRLGDVGRFLYIDIQDNGCGVAAEDEEKIFEPFFSKRHGTGLGLYLVREMCVANQAQIVYVRKSVGACFRLTMERYLANHNGEDEFMYRGNPS